jgi:N-acyl amino acid synthase of PEP-CTERM/exosortase system
MDSIRERIHSEEAGALSPLAQGHPRSGSLIDLYNRYFEVIPADTPERIDEVFRLRYQVYCVENPFENPAEHLDGLEHDAYDSHAVHSLLIHRPTGTVAGAVRLVLPREGKQLPITLVCSDTRLNDTQLLPRETTAEISRFAVSKQFRRRATDRLCVDYAIVEPPSPPDGIDRRVIPHITLGLMNAIVKMSWNCGITHWCAVMEPALLRLIGRLGIAFNPIGPLVAHHGLRQPCLGTISEVLAGLKRQRQDAWEIITDCGRYWGDHDIERQLG